MNDFHRYLYQKARTPVATRRKYRGVVKWTHRKFGPQSRKLCGEGTSIRRAISNALLAFFTDPDPGPKARRDAHVHLSIEMWRTKEPASK